jgi:glycosyltransferase involved in cell wall biosynthesis
VTVLTPRILLSTTVPVHFRAFHLPWVKRLRELGCVVHGAADRISEMPECVAAFDEVHDIPFSRNPLKLNAARVAGRAVAKLMDEKKIDLVHVHTPVGSFVTLQNAQHLRRTRGLKTVYTAHGLLFHPRGLPHTNFAFKILERIMCRWSDYLVVITPSDEAVARRLKLVPPAGLFYMPGVGIDLEQFSPARVSPDDVQRIRDELKLGPGDKIVTMVAEFTRNKRHRDVIEAFARLNRPDIHLALVGEGAHRSEVEAQVAQLRLTKTIHFLGYRRDVPALFRAATCATLTSRREGLPRSVMEALCLETPVVGSNARGISDLLAGGGGIIVPLGDTAKLADGIRELADNAEKARKMGAAGRRSMTPYSLQNVLALHEQLYRRALGERFPITTKS